MPKSVPTDAPVERVGRRRGILDRWWRGRLGGWGRVLDAVLLPAEITYSAVSGLYHGAYDRGMLAADRADVPVISIGNLVVGGSGKTPVTRWLVEEVRALGIRPGVLHGGYAEDEPDLHRAWYPDVPVVARADRAEGARQAIAAGAEVLLLDDAFQHRRLARDLDLVLVPVERWSPDPHLLPRGPWREPPAALRRADVVVVTRKTATAAAAEGVRRHIERSIPGLDVMQVHLAPGEWRALGTARHGSEPPGAGLAVAGIADPEPFWVQVRAAGVEPELALAFPDHHPYSPRDAERIHEAAGGRPIVTTAKDAIKLEPLLAGCALWVLEQRVVVEAGLRRIRERLDGLVG